MARKEQARLRATRATARARAARVRRRSGTRSALRNAAHPPDRGFGAACRIAAAEMTEEGARVTHLRNRLWSALAALPGILLNGSEHRRAPGYSMSRSAGVEGESLLLALSDLAVSSGSACATLRGEPSYVLRRSAAASSLRRVRCGSAWAATRPRTTSSERRCASEPRSSGCGRSRRQCWLRQADARRPALWGRGAAPLPRAAPGAGEVTGERRRDQGTRRRRTTVRASCSACAPRAASSSRRGFAPTGVRISSPRHPGSPSGCSARQTRGRGMGLARGGPRSRSRQRGSGD